MHHHITHHSHCYLHIIQSFYLLLILNPKVKLFKSLSSNYSAKKKNQYIKMIMISDKNDVMIDMMNDVIVIYD